MIGTTKDNKTRGPGSVAGLGQWLLKLSPHWASLHTILSEEMKLWPQSQELHLHSGLRFHTCPHPNVQRSARLPAAGSASARTVKSMIREVKSKAVCWPLWNTEMQWRSP